MQVVYLHGIGDGDPQYAWLDGLNRGLTQAGCDVIERDEVIAPRFSSYLTTEGISAKLPRRTYKPRNEPEVAARREFERRQARVQRLLRTKYGVRTFGFHLIPDAVWDAVPEFVIDHLPVRNLQQVRSYVRDDNVRGAVMRHVLDHLPTYGDVLLIAHSLGSIVAIDLLDRLPVDLHVRRFITIGSPGNIRTMHDGSQRLLKKFPYERVDDWSNIVNVRDVVTGGRGLANTFPGAQDFLLVIHGHDAGSYLGDVAVSGLVADALYPPEEVTVPPGAEIAVRMSEAEASALLLQHFAEAVARHIKDDDRAERYRAACKILRDELAAQLGHQATAGQLFAPAMQALIAGRLPGLPHRWELHEVVGDLVVMALTNCVTPYEIDPGDAPIAALEDIAEQLGFRRHIGTTVANAIVDVATCVTGKDRVRWGRVLTASTGLALLTAGPVGLAFAASAGAFGAAAISGRLAASGPDSLVAGLATLGGLAATSAATAAPGVASRSESDPGSDLEKLTIRVAAEHAHRRLDLPFDAMLWYQLANFEGQISAEINRRAPFDDPKSAKLSQLTEARTSVEALLRFMIDNGLAPPAMAEVE